MKITYDDTKQLITLQKRGLDFEDAGKLFAGLHYTDPDTRYDYGEDREITVGVLDGTVVVVVWTERDDSRRIISMRKANKYEQGKYYGNLD